MRGRVVGARDVSAVPVVIPHVHDAIVLHRDLGALDDSRKFLGTGANISLRVKSACAVKWALTSGDMYLSIAGTLGDKWEYAAVNIDLIKGCRNRGRSIGSGLCHPKPR